jgi:hypothetical protein
VLCAVGLFYYIPIAENYFGENAALGSRGDSADVPMFNQGIGVAFADTIKPNALAQTEIKKSLGVGIPSVKFSAKEKSGIVAEQVKIVKALQGLPNSQRIEKINDIVKANYTEMQSVTKKVQSSIEKKTLAARTPRTKKLSKAQIVKAVDSLPIETKQGVQSYPLGDNAELVFDSGNILLLQMSQSEPAAVVGSAASKIGADASVQQKFFLAPETAYAASKTKSAYDWYSGTYINTFGNVVRTIYVEGKFTYNGSKVSVKFIRGYDHLSDDFGVSITATSHVNRNYGKTLASTSYYATVRISIPYLNIGLYTQYDYITGYCTDKGAYYGYFGLE